MFYNNDSYFPLNFCKLSSNREPLRCLSALRNALVRNTLQIVPAHTAYSIIRETRSPTAMPMTQNRDQILQDITRRGPLTTEF